MIKLFGRAVFYKLVIYAKPYDARRVAVCRHPLQYRAAESAGYHPVFGGHDGLELFSHFMQYLLIQRLQPSHIVVSKTEC